MTDAERVLWEAYLEKKAKNPPATPALMISEKDWQEQVEQIAVMNAWKKYHTWNSKHSDPDFPDLIMLKGKRQVVAELKKEGEEPSAGQIDWLASFWETGAEVFVWHPSDLDYVVKVLQSDDRYALDLRGGIKWRGKKDGD